MRMAIALTRRTLWMTTADLLRSAFGAPSYEARMTLRPIGRFDVVKLALPP